MRKIQSTLFTVAGGRSFPEKVRAGILVHFLKKLRTSKILPRFNVLIFFQQFEAQNVLILFLTAIYSFMVENRPQRPSGVYACPVFCSRTCVHASLPPPPHLQDTSF